MIEKTMKITGIICLLSLVLLVLMLFSLIWTDEISDLQVKVSLTLALSFIWSFIAWAVAYLYNEINDA